jgi:tetratricopeptide (TPR) repeat protein
MDSVSQAANLYQRIQHDLAPRQLSQALNHLGMHSYRQENRERALALFRQALQASPANRAARYNFELLKRRMQQDPPPPPPKPKPRPAPRSPKARPTEKAGARLNMPPLPLPQARQELRRMRKEQPQFIQELKKEAAQSQGYSNKPQW